MRTCVVLAGLFLAASWTQASTIKPGEIWPDDHGQHIQAHGGGITKLGHNYYWFGEDYSPSNSKDKRYLACYSSDNLSDWVFRNQVVKLSSPEDLGRDWVLQRPKVFFNTKTRKYVMYAHIDDGNYKFARVALFTCDKPDGDYNYVRCFRPLNQKHRTWMLKLMKRQFKHDVKCGRKLQD